MFETRKIDVDVLRVEKPASKLPSYRGGLVMLMPGEMIVADGPIRVTQIDDEWDDIIEPAIDRYCGI